MCIPGTQKGQNRSFIPGISGAMVSGVAVYVNANGQLGTGTSSARFKTDIQDKSELHHEAFGLLALLVFEGHAPFGVGFQREIEVAAQLLIGRNGARL